MSSRRAAGDDLFLPKSNPDVLMVQSSEERPDNDGRLPAPHAKSAHPCSTRTQRQDRRRVEYDLYRNHHSKARELRDS
jgi:hypothetical protein